jgi:hypothetical protein
MMAPDATPDRNESASDASIALLTLLAQGDQDHRAGRTLGTESVDDIVRVRLVERRGAQ